MTSGKAGYLRWGILRQSQTCDNNAPACISISFARDPLICSSVLALRCHILLEHLPTCDKSSDYAPPFFFPFLLSVQVRDCHLYIYLLCSVNIADESTIWSIWEISSRKNQPTCTHWRASMHLSLVYYIITCQSCVPFSQGHLYLHQ